jgi:hypothetical protein
MPRFRYGALILGAIRGSALPKCRSERAHALILDSALADAVRRDSVEAVMHWFGVGRKLD